MNDIENCLHFVSIMFIFRQLMKLDKRLRLPELMLVNVFKLYFAILQIITNKEIEISIAQIYF